MGRGQELLEAAREGDRWTVEKILGQITKRSGPFTSLRRGAGVNVQDDNGYTPLHHACLRGHKDIVRLLLSVDALPCVVDKKGATPLHLAAWKGDSDIVSMLLEHNNPPVNIDQRTSDQETPLLIAAQFGYVEVVAQLLARGADADLRNMKDETALDLAAQYGRLETVQHMLRVRPLLVQPYKYPNSRDKIFSHTPLHRASMNGHKDVVLTLLDAGFDPNVRTYVGTPLHEAACFGKASVVRILLAKGADLHAVDGRGMTVESVLVEYSGEAIKRVRRVIREYESMAGNYNDVDEELPPFPVQGYSPTGYTGSAHLKAPETQKNTNKNESLFPSSSSLTKSSPQSFVKKLASKCLGLKAKFNSAPNISNSTGLESETDVKSKHSESKHSVNTLLIGNSKFFKILSKKEESGEIVCNDEFDTISLDRLGTLNRDSSVNRSNRSCPGFKTSLPNISENNELSDSQESIVDSFVVTDIHDNKNGTDLITFTEAVNYDAKLNIFEPRSKQNRKTIVSTISLESATLINECYESYEFSSKNSLDCLKPLSSLDVMPLPKPTPRSNAQLSTNDVMIYENIVLDSKHPQPTPAIRTHIPPKNTFNESFPNPVYENINLTRDRTLPEVPKRNVMPLQQRSNSSSPNRSRSSTMSSDSMVDESNLEDIFLSTKSKSFRHTKIPLLDGNTNRSNIHRVPSDVSDLSDQTEASALENVDCSGDVVLKGINLSMTGTLPNKKTERGEGKKVLFRHKTFTNIEVDRLSTNIRDLPKWNGAFLKETLPNYHIKGTSHCIHKAPTVQEFIHIFNRDSLQQDVGSCAKGTNNKRDSYFETAICFCKPRPSKHHASAEDLLEINKVDEEKVIIDMGDLKDAIEFRSSSFRCFCDTKMCILHDYRRQKYVDFVIKFSAVKKSISTPDISLEASPSSNKRNMGLTKIKSVPSNLATPYATVNVEKETPGHYNTKIKHSDNTLDNSKYVTMISHSSTSSSYDRYSVKDIAEVISLSNNSTSADTNPSCASDTMQILLRKSSSSEHSGQWSLQSCNSNVTIKSDASFKTCLEESSEDDSDANSHSDEETSDAETVKSDISTTKRPWVHSDSFKFGSRDSKFEIDVISEDSEHLKESKCESGISVECSESSSSGYEDDSGVPRLQTDVLLDCASLERGRGVGDVRSGSGRRRWDEPEGTSEGDALSVSSAASSCAPLHMTHHHDYNKVSPTPPKKPPRRNLSVSPTHANSPSSGYSYELRAHARSQDDLDDIQGAKHYLKHGRSVDQYVDGKLSYSEYEENHNSPRVIPVPNPRPSLKHRSQPVAITAMYENVVIKEQNPRRKLRRNNFSSQYENIEIRMNDTRTRKFSNQEKSSLESLLDDQSMNSPGECERYYDRHKPEIPLSPTHYEQPPTPDHPPPSAKQAENSIHERIRPLSQLIMEVVEEIRIRKKSQGDVTNS